MNDEQQKNSLVFLKENKKEARERMEAFWSGSSLGRPAIIALPSRQDMEMPVWLQPEPFGKDADNNPAWHVYCAQKTLASNHFLGEAFPYVFPNIGRGLVMAAEIAGIGYNYDGINAWIRHNADVLDRPAPVFDPGHPLVKKVLEILDAMAEAVGDNGIVGPPVLLDGMTTLSEILKQENLCIALIERPEDVNRWCKALDDLSIAAYEVFYQHLVKLGYGDTASWMRTLAKGRVEAVQCDFATMLSPSMFEEFAVPRLINTTDYLDFSLYHLDGICQLRFLDQLAKVPKLNGIQWNPAPQDRNPLVWLDVFKDMRRRGWLLWIWCNVAEAVVLTRELGADGLILALHDNLKDMDHAYQAIELIEKAARK